MKLLILTQVIDKQDPILGFFHNWVDKFSKKFDKTMVICLKKGQSDLNKDIQILSLGKEGGESKIKYIFRFYKYIIKNINQYNAVFVHMNQEYVLLGGLFWLLAGKKVYMWRNHHAGNLLTDLAAFFCTKVFCTSRFSYTAKYKKTVIMPVGIDTDLFRRKDNTQRVRHSILFLGRISPVKRPDLLIDALIKLNEKSVDFTASFYGDSLPKDKMYYDSLVKMVLDAGLSNKIKFYSGIPNEETVDVYNKNEIFVNLSSSGMFDKTIFEAMACGALSLSCNRNLIGKIPDEYYFSEDDMNDLARKLQFLLSLSLEDKIKRGIDLRKYTEDNHSLNKLSEMIKENINE